MTKKEQLRRRIIELIHGVPYEQAIKREWVHGAYIEDEEHSPSRIMFSSFGTGDLYFGVQIGGEGTTNFMTGYINPKIKMLGLPITLGRLLKALKSVGVSEFSSYRVSDEGALMECYYDEPDEICYWLLTLPSGQEATLDEQTEETINALHQLLCK